MTLPIDLVLVRHGQSEANVVQKREKDIDVAVANGETDVSPLPEALAIFDIMVARHPRETFYYIPRGLIHLSLGHSSEALANCRAALAIESDGINSPWAHALCALTHSEY